MPSIPLPLSGSCCCGRVEIRVSRPPLATSACHCRGCQKMSSSAYSLTAVIPADGFEVTKGEPVIGGLHGPDTHHYFCPHCMTWAGIACRYQYSLSNDAQLGGHLTA